MKVFYNKFFIYLFLYIIVFINQQKNTNKKRYLIIDFLLFNSIEEYNNDYMYQGRKKVFVGEKAKCWKG